MTTIEEERATDSVTDELRSWLEANWDPALTVGEWWDRLGRAGWAAPMLPTTAYGRGLTRVAAQAVARTIGEFGALAGPTGLAVSLAAPTIATHGTPEQIERFIPDIVCGRAFWCQLFSEPGAGSDLAGLSTRAVRDGDVWIVNGQKVWTSGGQWADLGMLLARTDPTAPKHQGITWFALDMHQPGVEVRPLREMTGNALFNEVFFTDATVRDTDRIGEANGGWRVANTTLLYERTGMGAGDRPTPGQAFARPGRHGELDRPAGEFIRQPAERAARSESAAMGATSVQSLIALARSRGRNNDPVTRQGLAQSYILNTIIRLNTERHRAVRAMGGEIPGLPNFSKLLMADIIRLQRDLSMGIVGARGMLHGYDEAGRAQLRDAGVSEAGLVTAGALSAQALPIFGGTDQIQRNIVSERALGLPKEPGDLAHVPFNELPKNG